MLVILEVVSVKPLLASAVAVAALATPLAAQSADPVIYTMVSEWTYPRAQWQEVNTYFEKTVKPILDRHMASGSIIEWGRGVPLIHTADGSTHMNWYAGTSIAGLNRVLADLTKLPPSITGAATKHHDQLLRSVVYRAPKDRKGGQGFMMLSASQIAPGRAQQWRELWDKETQPLYQKLMDDGTILGYGIDQEFIHTDAIGWRYDWVVLSSMESLDKLNAAFDARMGARTPEQRRALGASMRENTVAGSHRDGLYHMLDYAHK